MLFSIAIPTLNSEKTIENCIKSCINQEYSKELYEIVIIDNNSSDKSKNIINKFKEEINVLTYHNSERVSMYENHNLAIEKCSGNYIIFCHSDDTLDKFALHNLYLHLESKNFPKKHICWGHSLYRDFNQYLYKNNFTFQSTFSGMYAIMVFFDSGLTPSGTCYSNDFKKYGGFLTSSNGLAPCDSSTMVLLATKGFSFTALPYLLFYRFNSRSFTNIHLVDHYEAYSATFKDLFAKIGSNYKLKIWKEISFLHHTPFNFLYYFSSHFPFKVFIYLLKLSFKKPHLLFTKEYLIQIKKLIRTLLQKIK